MQATDRFMGCRSLALCVEIYLFSSVTMALNSTGTVETKPSKSRDRSSCITHFTSDSKGCTSWIGVAPSTSLVSGCLGKRRPTMTLKLSVWFWLLLPSSDILSRLRIHARSWCRWRCGMPVRVLMGMSLRIISVLSSTIKPLSSMMLNRSWKMILTCEDLINPFPQSTKNVLSFQSRSQYLLIISSGFPIAILLGVWERTEHHYVWGLFWLPLLSILVSYSVCISSSCLIFF